MNFSAGREEQMQPLEPAKWENGNRSMEKPSEKQNVRGQTAITGIGVLSPIGNDLETITDALKNGNHGLQPITRFDASHFRTNLGGEIRGIDPHDYLTAEEIAMYDDRYLQYAIITVRKALADAALELDPSHPRDDIALVLGTCNGGLLSAEEEYKWLHGKSLRPFDEKMNLTAQYYGFGKAMAHVLGVTGEVWIVTTACSSTTGAIGLAQMLVNHGYYKTVIVGGSDSLCVANMSGFNGLKAVAQGQTAPFSLPVGLNIGEASCFWIVEEMERALSRNARCKGKLAGHATSCDAYHATAPDPRGDGVYRTLSAAFSDSGLPFASLGCINTHGTGTEANDRAESRGIARFIGEQPVPVTSTKSFFGHCMGTAGILEATCNLMAMNNGFLPPTLNFSTPRPGCTLDYVPNKARNSEYQVFISANYAFAGNNASAVITRCDTPLPPRPAADERVMITGAGSVSSLGLSLSGHREALQKGECGIGPVTRLGLSGITSQSAGLVQPFRAVDVDRRLDLSGMNTISRYATVAVHGALSNGNLRVRQKLSEHIGIVMGICNGPPESDHMNQVFSSDNFTADITNFSSITANSTAGWVAASLALKGMNMTLSPGHHAGIQCCAYAFEMLRERRAKAVVAAAADELYPQTYYNYDLIGFLYQNEKERKYRMYADEPKRKVVGEGAGALLLETLTSVRERQADVWGEVLGYGMAMDLNRYDTQCCDAGGVTKAVATALQRSNCSATDIDCIAWAPQGNTQDFKIIDGLKNLDSSHFDKVPFVGTTFNTGYIESASALLTLGVLLDTIRNKTTLWPQLSGVPELDRRETPEHIHKILIIGSSDLGYTFALIVDTEPELPE